MSVACLTACVLADVALDQRGCPCVDGWVCRDDVCVPAAGSVAIAPDGGASDASGDDGGCGRELTFDPQNCGACGHDCNGATCGDGVCVPTPLVAHASFPARLALTPEVLVFTTENPPYPGATLSYCERAKCNTSTPLYAYAIGQVLPLSMTTNAAYVFWGQGTGKLSRFALRKLGDGGYGRQEAQLGAAVLDLTVDGTRFFVADGPDAGSIHACDADDLATCQFDGGALLARDQSGVRSLVVEPTSKRLFWIADDRGGAILSCPSDAPCTEPLVVASGQPNAHALAADASRVYWTDATASGAVLSAPVAGLAPNESPAVLARDLTLPWGIAVDGDYVYVTTLGASAVADAGEPDGTIVRIPRAGGAPMVLAKRLSRPWAVVVDGPSIYWTNRGTANDEGSVESVAK